MKKAVVLVVLLMCSIGFARVSGGNVGKMLPPLTVSYVSNPPASTSGKPMIVEFWATWCGPCRQTIPHLNEIYKSYKDRGLVVIGISDEDKGKIDGFMKTLPMNYSVASDAGGRFANTFNITGIPHALLVNSSGKIVWEGHPAELDAREIDKILVPGMNTTSAPAPTGLAPLPANKRFY